MSQPRRAPSIRARVRAELVDEIKATARRHLAEHGAANLSLRAVARELGFVSSAVYRYFAGRDDLLTALILDGYHALGAAAETRESAVPRDDLPGRFAAIAHAARDWARANPNEYALLYGTPVPGYHAPPETTAAAGRVTTLLAAILVDAAATGRLAPIDDVLPPALTPELASLAGVLFPGVAPPAVARGLVVWTELFGAISFDVFNRLDGIIVERDAWFDHQIAIMARFAGLPTEPDPAAPPRQP